MALVEQEINDSRLDLDMKLKNNVSVSTSPCCDEFLLNPENNRLTVYPIKNESVWNAYKKQQAAFWTAEEVDFSKDYEHFIRLNPNEQHFIKMILAFFSSSDTIVNINLGERFMNDVKIREALFRGILTSDRQHSQGSCREEYVV
jgi:ribonucleotide reductase beta subunit family protein with ferritin-like domain